MSHSDSLSILTLPVELFHRIFDYLDSKTILLSLSVVCTQLQAATRTYDRYAFNLRSISKSNFYRMCNAVRPENVTSLMLSNDNETPGQIELFLSLVDIRRFTRLQSLAFFLTNDDNLDIILNQATKCSLTGLSIERPRSQTHRNTTFNLLSSIMAQLTLRKITCTVDLLSSKRLQWPLQCTLEHLTIDRCTRKEFCVILDHLPHLRTIVLCSFNLDVNSEYERLSTSDSQLTSLSMKGLFLSMDKLDSFLSLVPSLIHLRLEGPGDDAIFKASQWERVIRTKLLSLEQFEFCFRSQHYRVIELSVVQFRTPFWLNERHWFISCVYDNTMEEILLYSKPTFLTELEYNFIGPIIISTIVHNKESDHFVFRKVTELELSEYALDSFDFRSTLVNLSQIIKLRVIFVDTKEFILKTQMKLFNLLQITKNVHSLEVSFEHGFVTESILIESICSVIPHHVKHLDIEVRTLVDIDLVLDKFEHLTSITFRNLQLKFFSTEKLTEWLKQLKQNPSYQYHNNSLHLWLNKPSKDDRTRKIQ